MKVHIKIHGQNVAVEVSVEVYKYLDRADHKTENLFHEQRRHWDGREFDEYIIAHECSRSYYETPEDWLCRKETLREITAALENCTAKQRYRFLLYALEGLSCSQIGNICGCSKSAIMRSIEAVRKKVTLCNQSDRERIFRLTGEGLFALSHKQKGQAVSICLPLLLSGGFRNAHH